MALSIFIFIFYCVVFSYVITIIPFFKQSLLSSRVIVFLFLIKVAAGLLYGYYYHLPSQQINADTWRFYNESLSETNTLLHHPVVFCKDFFYNKYATDGGLFAGHNSYWNDVKDAIPIKLIAIFNVFTNKNYYANVLFFNAIFFLGSICLYKLMTEVYGQRKKAFLLAVFCIPSTLFWCSGIHKDGLIFAALGVLFYTFHRAMQHAANTKRVLLITFCLVFIFLLRNYIFFALIPVMVCWYLMQRFPIYKWWWLVGVYAVFTLCFFNALLLHPSLNFPQYVVGKQHEFLLLKGNSLVQMPTLVPTFAGFIRHLPFALDMAFAQPHFGFVRQLAYAPFVIENYCLFFVVLLCIGFSVKSKKYPFAAIASWLLAGSVLLLSGYIVVFIGAIVRYKSIFLPFIIAPFLGMLDTKKVKRWMLFN